MRVLLSVTLAASLSGNIGAIAQSLATSNANQAAIINQSVSGNAADTKAASAKPSAAPDIKAPASQTATLKDPKSGCAVVAIDDVASDSVAWTGHCAQGMADGAGTLTFSNQGKLVEAITGTFDKGVVHDGQVQIKFADGSSYVGNAVAGHMDGTGVLTTADGDRFQGQWMAGHMTGQGSALWANGDRYDGAWQDGKASGHGVQVWSDGRKYDGEWKDDQPNGHGVVTRKDGTRFEADFVDGRPNNPTALEAVAISDTPIPTAAAMPASIAHADATPPAAGKDSSKPTGDNAALHPQPAAIAGISGKKLLAIDGSSLTLTTNDDGIAREIVAPNGTAKKNQFAFLNDRVGSVSDGENGNKVVGVFRLTAKGIVTEYSDGRSEVLYPNTEGGVSMLLNAPTGDSFCMAWYPEGHHFSLDDRKAALAEYASKLGLDASAPKKGSAAKPAPKPSCGTPAADASGAPLPATHGASEIPKLTPIPKPERHAAIARPFVQAASTQPASFTAPTPPTPGQPVEVRNATIHTIDADARDVTPGHEMAALEPHPAPSAAASQCLSVESDGQHWAFRNHCGYDVQFAYCLMNTGDPLASCDKGSISGSVSPNGSSALIADKSLSETNADHDFRWVACSGGAGEVVVHLDKSDPPAGRCVRPGAS